MFEGKQRLWEKEVEELKRLYAAKLRQVSQHAQRSQRSLQLQLFKVQQEKNRLQEELDGMRKEMCQEAGAVPRQTSPTLEETQWEVRPWKARAVTAHGREKHIKVTTGKRQDIWIPCLSFLNRGDP